MGIVNREGALYAATGIDNTGLYSGRREALGIIKAMAGEITSFDVFGGLGISAAVAFAQAAKGAYDFEKEFQKNMLEVATISTQVSGSMTDFMNQVLSITQVIPVKAPEAAKALYQIVSAGHDGAAGMKVLEVAAKAAIGGVTETATAADAITTLINAYKMSADDAEKVSDQLFTTARLGKTTFGELGQSIAQVAPIAASYGVEMDQVLAAVATLTKSGTPTAQAMTQIRAAIIGVSKYLGDGAFNTMTFQEALDLVAKKANGSEEALRGMITEVEGVTGLLGLTGINANAAAGDLDEMNRSAGATEAAFKKMAESADAQLQLLSNNITAALRPMGEMLLKEVSDIASAFNTAFSNGDIQESMKNLGALIVTVTGALVGYKGSIIATTAAKTLSVAVTNWLIKAKTAEAVRIVLSGQAYAAEAAVIAKNTAAHVLLTNALKAQFVAMLKNTAAMLTNPYVLAGIAVAALGYSIYNVATAQSEMSKATSLLSKHLGESTSAALSEQRELTRLKGELQGCKEGSEEYSKVKSEIINKFGKYDKTLTDETLSVQTLTDKYRSLTEAIQSSFGARQYENFKKEQQDSLDKVFSKNLGKLQDRLSDELGDGAGSKIYTKIRLALLEGKELDQDVKSVLDKIQDKGTMFADSRADAYINNIREAQEAADNIDKKAKVKFGINNDDISKQGEGGFGSKGKEAEKKAASEWLSSYKKAYEDAEKAYNDFLKSKKLMSDADRDKELKRLKGLRDKTKTTYESKGGSTSSDDKQENQSDELRQQNEKLKLLLDKQSLDRIRAEEDAANEIAEAKIDADQDGAEKVLKQREFNHEKELLSIKREAGDRKQAMIDAARSAHESNPENKEKPFDAEKFVKSKPAKKQFASFDKVAEEKTKTTETKYNRGDDLNDLINEYQDFADRRMSIEKKFNEDLKVLDVQRKTALEKGDMDQVDKIDRSKVEAGKKKKEDLSGVSLDEFKADIDWATLFGNLDVLSPESLNKLRDKLKAFIETAADKLKPEDLKVLSEAMTNIDLTIADKTPYEALKSGISGYKTATDEASVAQGKLNQLQKDGKEGTEAYKDATRELTDAQRKRQESLKTMTQATNNIGEKGKELVTAGSDITDMLTSLGVSLPESISGALDGMGQVMDSLASIDFMKPMSIITGITGTLAGLGKTIGSFFGGNGDKAAKDSERLEEVNNRIAESEKIINGLIEKRIELIKEATIAEQKNLSVTTQQAINNQKKYYEQQLDGLSGNWLLAKSGKNNNLTLEDLGIGSIKELEEFLNSDRLLELQRDGYGIRDAEQWKAIIDGYNSIIDKEEELQDMMAKNLTGMTLDDAKNALDDFVRDADTSFSDVADNFEDHMRDAMFNIVKQNYLNKAMEDWYKDFEESMSDGALDKEEAGSLKNRYENAYTEAQNRYLAMLEAAGISAESDPTREASKKGIATASQDSVDENNGRLTVIQGHTYSINEKLTEITNFGRVIMSNCAHLPRLEDIGNNLRALTVSQDVVIGHLSNIEKNTARLEAIENTMVSMNRGIQDINTKGLTLKR